MKIAEDESMIGELILNLPDIFQKDAGCLRREFVISRLATQIRASMIASENGQQLLSPECTRTTIWVLRFSRHLIEKAWGLTLDTRDDEGGEEEDAACFPIQMLLNENGMTALCVDLIAPGIDDEAKNEAINLLTALLFREGGNINIQETIFKHLHEQSSSNFFAEIFCHLASTVDWVTTENEEKVFDLSCIFKLLRFLQLSMEGHYLKIQDIYREQTGKLISSMNMLDKLVELLDAVTRRPSRSASKVAFAVLSVILESLQGPALRNQEFYVNETKLQRIINHCLRRHPQNDQVEEEELKVKFSSVKILQALFEGRKIGDELCQKIVEVADLEVLASKVDDVSIAQDYSSIEEEMLFHTLPGGGRSNMLSKFDEHANLKRSLEMHVLVLLRTFIEYCPCLTHDISVKNVIGLIDKHVRSVEIVWQGSCMRRFMYIPARLNLLVGDATKKSILRSINILNDDKKLLDFMFEVDNLFDELKWQVCLLEVGLNGIFCRDTKNKAHWFLFGLALLLNLLFLLSYEYRSSAECVGRDTPSFMNSYLIQSPSRNSLHSESTYSEQVPCPSRLIAE